MTPSATAIFGLVLAALPAMGHHAFAAEFDGSKPVTVKGVVTKVEWANPHMYFYLDVKDSGGKTVQWRIQASGPNTLLHQGWTRDTVHAGEVITVTAYRARDGANLGSARTVVLPDGRAMSAGCKYDGGPGN